jgi:pimeloyl-ACP methyl ester carboxylesterase
MTSYATSDGVRLGYDELGEGEPLLFVQGLGYDRQGFGPLPHLLAEDFHVVVFDNRGVGDSDVPDGPYSVPMLAADAIAVLDAAGIESAHVLGVSLGGFIAQELALAHPERIRKLVLCSTAPSLQPPCFPVPERGLQAFAAFPTMEREAGLRLMVENSLGDHAVRERPELVEEILRYRLERAPTLAAWQAQAMASATFDAYERVAEIGMPTLVIHADDDLVVDFRNGQILAERIPGAQFEVVADRGHLVMWEEGEALAPVVREFLRS